MGLHSFIQKAGRHLQPFYILWRFLWVVLLAAFMLVVVVFMPDEPASWHPEQLTTALRLRKTVADFLGAWAAFIPWSLAIIVAIVLGFFNWRARRKIQMLQRLLPRLHEIASGVLRQHFELMRSLQTADFEPNHPSFRQNVAKIAPHLDLVCRRIAISFGDITGEKCHCTIKREVYT